MAKILVTGGVTYNELIYLERFPEPRSQTVFSHEHRATVGGTGAGKALNLNRLGHDVTLHALIGDDSPGRFVRELFNAEGLRFVDEIDPAGTERHINLMDSAGDRISIYVNYATFKPEIDQSRLASLVAACDVVALNIINYCRAAIAPAKAAGKPLWVDIHDYDGENDYHREFIEAADVLFMSSDAMPDYKPFMQAQFEAGKQIVVCTHGKDGATAISASGWDIIAPRRATVIDTNGAGDSFFSGFLHAYLQGLPVQTCLESGAIVASLCVESPELFSRELSAVRVAALRSG